MAVVPYTATIPYIASDAQPLRLHAQCRSAGQSRLCQRRRFTRVGHNSLRPLIQNDERDESRPYILVQIPFVRFISSSRLFS
jgi:hypothetical protein